MNSLTPPLSGPAFDLAIERLGGLGDGIGRHLGQAVFVPFTAPGDLARVTLEAPEKAGRARLDRLITPSPLRQEPPCLHFGLCGGCQLQHVQPRPYDDFKRDIVARLCERLAIDPAALAETVSAGPGARRRVTLGVAAAKGDITIGYQARQSHRLFDLLMCPVSEPGLIAIVPKVRAVLATLKKPGRIASLSIEQADQGLNLLFTLKDALTPADRAKLAALGEHSGIARIASRGAETEILRQPAALTVTFGGVPVALPPGAFRQATALGERTIVAAILAAFDGPRVIADLFSGLGTYSFPLIGAGHRVGAFEGDITMVEAMQNAARRHGLDDRLTAGARDLFRDPLSAEALRHYTGAVINPPRNGATPQIRHLSESGVPTIALVSCNPATFERDARLLLENGYRVQKLVPIDQFYWSHHLELVAIFTR